MSRALVVRELGTSKEIHRVDVSGQSERGVERVMRGMLINLNERYYIDDSEAYSEQAREEGK